MERDPEEVRVQHPARADDNAPYANYDAVRDYPGHVVNCNPKLTGGEMSWQKIQAPSQAPVHGPGSTGMAFWPAGRTSRRRRRSRR